MSASSTLCLADCGIAQRYRWPFVRVKDTGSLCYKERGTGADIKRMLPLQTGALPGLMAGTGMVTLMPTLSGLFGVSVGAAAWPSRPMWFRCGLWTQDQHLPST